MAMPAAVSLPPPVPVRESPPGLLPFYAAGALVVLATLIAGAMVDGRIFFPGCGFRWITDLPCPGCGGTRSLAALGRLDATEAFWANPLVATLALLMLVLVPVVALDDRFNRGRIRVAATARASTSRALRWTMVALVAINWMHLVRVLG